MLCSLAAANASAMASPLDSKARVMLSESRAVAMTIMAATTPSVMSANGATSFGASPLSAPVPR